MTAWKRLIRFVARETGKIHIGEPVDSSVDVGLATKSGVDIKVNVFRGQTALNVSTESTGEQLTVDRVLSPLSKDDVKSICCIGLNYGKHAAEAKMDEPKVPVLFMKHINSLNDPYPAPVIIPKFAQDGSSDYESELCVIIGKDAKDVPEAKALSYVLGYVASNDISARKHQFAQSQWCFSKSLDTYCPIGPTLVSSEVIPDPSQLNLKGYLNGKLVQETSLKDLIFSVPKLIAFLSQGTTLKAGTIILTGTPSGVGFPQDIHLKDGDEFQVNVDQGLGMSQSARRLLFLSNQI